MDIQAVKKQLLEHEGVVLHAYKDSRGYLTIGCGRLIDKRRGGGITREEAMYLLENDIRKHLKDLLRLFPDWDYLPEPVQHVLINMHFNLGSGGFRGFRNMIAAVHDKDWVDMKKEMLYSQWAKQVGTRSGDLAAMIDGLIEG